MQRVYNLLDLYYINSFGPLRTFLGLKADPVTLGKRLEAVALDRRIVYKYICSVFACYKAKTFGFIEPLYCSF